jgi:hypothetical protein
MFDSTLEIDTDAIPEFVPYGDGHAYELADLLRSEVFLGPQTGLRPLV